MMFDKQITVGRLLSATAAFLAAFVATASAAEALTISPGTRSLTGRVAITAPVMVTCSPFDPTLTLDSESINVQVEQAAGKAIAHGTGVTSGFSPTLLFPCDGSQRTNPITIYADAAGPPFHRGKPYSQRQHRPAPPRRASPGAPPASPARVPSSRPAPVPSR